MEDERTSLVACAETAASLTTLIASHIHLRRAFEMGSSSPFLRGVYTVGQKVNFAANDFWVIAALRGTRIWYGVGPSESSGNCGAEGEFAEGANRRVVTPSFFRIRFRCAKCSVSKPDFLSHLMRHLSTKVPVNAVDLLQHRRCVSRVWNIDNPRRLCGHVLSI